MMTNAMRATLSIVLSLLLVGCGARSELEAELAFEGEERCVSSSIAEVCDGVDNDCDGQIDEDVAPVHCGENGCEVEVRCENGVMPACIPRTATVETCNLLDDDCDGEVDEGFGFGPLGDVIVLRNDEFDTGGCTSCSWAFGAALAPANDGFVALWNLGLSGGSEQPTLYGRPIDGFGNPTGAIALERQDFLLGLQPMLALQPMPARGLPIEAIYRVGSGDVPGLLFVNTAGDSEVVMPTPVSGAHGVSRTVWTGERFVSAWEDNAALRVAVLDANGSLEREVEVDELDRPAAITLGVFPGRVGILVTRYREEPERRDQWFLLLDAFGNVQAPARQIDVAYTTWQRLVGTEEGWLHIRPNGFQEPSTRQALDVAGDPLVEALPFSDGRTIQDSGLQDTFIPRPGLNEMAAAWQDPQGGDMHVEFLNGRGDVLRGWSGPLQPDPGYDEGFFSQPHITFVDDRMLMIWHGLADNSVPNRVSVRPFGCVP
jgi:hypothetical protein